MAMKITSKTKEPLLSRTTIKAHITFEAATPSNEEISKKIADETNKDVKLVVMKKIDTYYGSKQADVDAVVYDSAEAKETIERKTKAMKEAEKKAAEEAKKKEEEAKEKKTEDSAEEKAEDKKPETDEKKEEKEDKKQKEKKEKSKEDKKEAKTEDKEE